VSKETLSKVGGWAFALSGLGLFLLWGALVEDSNSVTYDTSYMIFQTVILLVYWIIMPLSLLFGLFSLHSRFESQIGAFWRNLLMIGSIGTLMVSWTSWVVYLGGGYLPFPGPGIGYLCLGLFGIVAMRRKLLPRMNWLPLVAGLPFPLWRIGYLIDYLITSSNRAAGDFSTSASVAQSDVSNVLFILTFTIILVQVLALVVLGFILQTSQPAETDETAALA
jgi:hypothetical protein